ncbi:MAG: arylesterase [Nitrospinaceae bacterium]|nr:arylesterase [Nitrospinaceae bacterium]NIR54836.1 arylesterase [Nitrospinaceae bacterium]NIS85261.1 arylesterase [Nitrospinaceae bacterium]NIT82074.1 arylesterase [Nitrospinaceae bacterium]NIU44335.1 arylesterase [Nitrospinaceae bacterium]
MESSAGYAEPVILAFGDSLTAGYRVDARDSYPARLQRLLREKGYSYKVVNAGVSGDTTAGGAARIGWALQHDPEIVIIQLGANDGLRGLPIREMRRNLGLIIEACRKKGAKVLLAGMEITPNLGEEYSREFREVFPELAKKYDVPLLPFFLKDVAARPELTQPDGVHPLAEGYAIVTQTVWHHLEPMLKK